MKDKLRDIHQTDLEKFRIKKSSKLKQKEKEIIEQYKQVKAEREKTGPAPLSDLQEKFVDFYCSRYGEWSVPMCRSCRIRKGSYARASELLDYKKNPSVVLEIQQRLAALRQQWDIDRDKHLAMLTKIRDEARIKGQYGVVAKCEELRGKVGGLYIEKSMVLSKDIKDDTSNEALRKVWGSREDFEKSMLIMAEDMYPDQKSSLYDDSIEITEEELEAREGKGASGIQRKETERTRKAMEEVITNYIFSSSGRGGLVGSWPVSRAALCIPQSQCFIFLRSKRFSSFVFEDYFKGIILILHIISGASFNLFGIPISYSSILVPIMYYVRL